MANLTGPSDLSGVDGVDGGQQAPIRQAGVEQDSDPVVLEGPEAEADSFDAFDEVVDSFGGAVGDKGLVPVGDLGVRGPR